MSYVADYDTIIRRETVTFDTNSKFSLWQIVIYIGIVYFSLIECAYRPTQLLTVKDMMRECGFMKVYGEVCLRLLETLVGLGSLSIVR